MQSALIVDDLPPGKITAFPEWGDDDDDWIVGVRHSQHAYTHLATCPSKRFAKSLAKMLNGMPRTEKS